MSTVTTLYEKWRSVARERRDEFALRDLAAGRRWTFGQLAAEVEADGGASSPVAFPQGIGASFILEVLRAWRLGRIVCPLETGQPQPDFPLPASSIVHLKTTSATTGRPRLVAFTAGQLAADAANIVAAMGLRPEWPNLGIISLAHSYGFSNLVTPLLLHGIPLILLDSALPEAVRRAACGEKALTLASVPALWRAWYEAAAIPPNVCLAVSAGAPLPAGLERAVFAAGGLKIHNFYGASECGGIAYDQSDQPRSDDAFVGTALAGVNLDRGADGCLRVQSRAVGETYWPEPAPTLGHGNFQTSDLADLGPAGVTLRGRLGDLINVAGRKVAPETIEQALRLHPEVRECVVVGIPADHAGRGEKIAALVVLRVPVSAAALRQFLLERLPAWQVPRLWRFAPSLPADVRGKVSRAALRSAAFTPLHHPQGSGLANLAGSPDVEVA